MVDSIKKQLTPKKFRAQELNKSKGILDDHPIRKFIGTKEGTITKDEEERYLEYIEYMERLERGESIEP